MAFVIDERVKHRLTGLVVILAVAIIFIPAVVKKSNHHFEENINLSVRLPTKPPLPKVAVPDQKALFNTVKVAHVTLPTVVDTPRAQEIAKAHPLSQPSVVPTVAIAKQDALPSKVAAVAKAAVTKAMTVNKAKVLAKANLPKPAIAKIQTPSKPAVRTVVAMKNEKNRYGVQIASFTQQNNAKQLVSKLRSKGYAATYNRFSGKQGEFYQVIVGQLTQREKAEHLQKQLAANMQLNGFVVKTGVS